MKFVLWVAFLFFAVRRTYTYLHIFQQEEYDGPRFLRWMLRNLIIDRRATVALLAIWLVGRVWTIPNVLIYGGACAALVLLALLEPDPRKLGKKRLAMTQRANRTFYVAMALDAALSLAIALLVPTLAIWVLPVQAIPFLLVLGNACLLPYEHANQRRFWNEAHSKLENLHPFVIGVTGSYGKTSVKHILAHVLGTQAPTLATPGSVNTPMGISRIVREQLGSHHRYFLCEMGAYGPGSIERLCRLAPPNLGIITAIGAAHYERFRSLDTVAEAKFELAESVVSRGGKVIVAEETLHLPYAAKFYQAHRSQMIVVGSGEGCELRVSEPKETHEGLSIEVAWEGQSYVLLAHLYGRHHAMNLAIAFAAACVLGVPPGDAQVAMNSVPQIGHRLEVKRLAEGYTLIDDAYNSNPVGFVNGLQLLSLLRNGAGRRILVTPGMVELGAAHDEEHRKVGLVAGKHVDVLLPVMPHRIQTLVNAYRETTSNGTVVPCNTFADAQSWMTANLQPDDVVLLENDLPDLYEKIIRL